MESALLFARPAMLDQFREEGSCVAAARILIDALAYFGIKAEPRAVVAFVLNDAARQMAEDGATIADIYAEALKHTVEDTEGPWTMGLGAPDEQGNPGAGHVVVYVPDVDGFLDITLDQMNRPQKNLVFEPMRFRGDPAESLSFVLDNGTVLIYEPDDPHYKKSPNWRGVSRGSTLPFTKVTGTLIRVMKKVNAACLPS